MGEGAAILTGESKNLADLLDALARDPDTSDNVKVNAIKALHQMDRERARNGGGQVSRMTRDELTAEIAQVRQAIQAQPIDKPAKRTPSARGSGGQARKKAAKSKG